VAAAGQAASNSVMWPGIHGPNTGSTVVTRPVLLAPVLGVCQGRAGNGTLRPRDLFQMREPDPVCPHFAH